MPFNGSGGFTIVNTFVPGTTILSSAVNQNYSDIATSGLSNCLTKDGQQTWGANQKAGGFIISGLGSGTVAGNSVEWQQWQNSTVPVGTVVDFAGTTAPSLWYFCDGTSMTTVAFPALFAVIGYTYGGSGGNFSRPDYRGIVTAGRDNMGGSAASRIGTVVTDSGTITGTTLGSTGGSSTHVQTTGELATHTPSGSIAMGGSQTISGLVTTGGAQNMGSASPPANNEGDTRTINGSSFTATFTGNPVGSSTAMAWLQPTAITNKIIFANA